MNQIKLLSLVLLVTLFSCSKDTRTEEYTLAVPITVSLEEFRTSIDIIAPQPIMEPGKMYVYQNYVFVNELNEGIHVIDNSNPETPKKINFLKIKGNNDIAVKNNILYGDSKMDLVYFDITNIEQIVLLGRLENVLPFDVDWPQADVWDTQNVDFENEVIIDWVVTTQVREVPEYDNFEDGAIAINDAGGSVGQGGSLARFNIVNNNLYAVDRSNINVFDIANLSSPVAQESVYVGWDVETIFSDNNYLYIGTTSGMFIYDLVNPNAPVELSQITHILGCDPVVVQGDYAYVTIRGGNFCGQEVSQLEIIDVSDRSNPYRVKEIEMNEPYGLGVKDDALYVSDGDQGLKLFNVESPIDTFLELEFPEIIIKDVIPMEDKLLLIGDEILYQFHYTEGNLDLISAYNLN